MFAKLFLNHPRSVNESYFAHMRFALRISGQLFYAAFGAFVHAFLPAACEKTASQKIESIYAKTHNRGQ